LGHPTPLSDSISRLHARADSLQTGGAGDVDATAGTGDAFPALPISTPPPPSSSRYPGGSGRGAAGYTADDIAQLTSLGAASTSGVWEQDSDAEGEGDGGSYGAVIGGRGTSGHHHALVRHTIPLPTGHVGAPSPTGPLQSAGAGPQDDVALALAAVRRARARQNAADALHTGVDGGAWTAQLAALRKQGECRVCGKNPFRRRFTAQPHCLIAPRPRRVCRGGGRQ